MLKVLGTIISTNTFVGKIANMGGKHRFEDSFWEGDFNGTTGFEALCKRVRDGQKTAKDVEEFFRKKSKAQSKFGRSLLNLARSIDGREETGDLAVSWQELKFQTEETAKFHENAAAEYSKLADDISKFTENLKVEAKQMEEKVVQKQRSKKSAYTRLLELQKTYHEKCREMITQEAQLETAKQSVTMNPKELEKTKVRVEKSKESVDKADSNYRQAVETLETARKYWETDMVEACRLFQHQEESRREKLRDFLWQGTNLDSQVCVDWDNSCEKVRKCLEKCLIDEDIQEFINKQSTGRLRPASIAYENYFDDRSNKGSNGSPRNKRPSMAPPAIPGIDSTYSMPFEPTRIGAFHY